MSSAKKSLEIVEEARYFLLATKFREPETRVGLATVDCRLCGKTDYAVLLDVTIWEMQTHKASYAFCSKFDMWTAEAQGPQREKTKKKWLEGAWSLFNPANSLAIAAVGTKTEEPVTFKSLAEWVFADFYNRQSDLKNKLIQFAKDEGDGHLLRKMLEMEKIESLNRNFPNN